MRPKKRKPKRKASPKKKRSINFTEVKPRLHASARFIEEYDEPDEQEREAREIADDNRS